MSDDARARAARFYDLAPSVPDDVPFYIGRLPSSRSRVLELGCGTGRVALALAPHCASVHGVDLSESMLEIARDKAAAAGLTERVRLDVADISDLRLAERYDFIIAPFRVLQTLESDAQVAGLLRGIREHLEPGGRCILNVFMPMFDAEAMRTDWVTDEERLFWEVDTPEGPVACFDRRVRIDAERLVLYPEIVYRRYAGDEVVEEAVLPIVMKCYYPHELTALVESAGFDVLDKWGGYEGEAYGEGPELVVEFGLSP